MLSALVGLDLLAPCCCLPARAPGPEDCHEGHHAQGPASHDADDCSCELHAKAVDLDRSSGLAAPPVPSLAALIEQAAEPQVGPPEAPSVLLDLPPPPRRSSPAGLRAPPLS